MKSPLRSATIFVLLATTCLAGSPDHARAAPGASGKAGCGEVGISKVTARANQLRKLITGVGSKIQFTSRVGQEGCTGLTYEWSFGDGAASAEQDPVHAYTMPGNYGATLTVSCNGGCDRKEATVQVTIVAVDLDIESVPEEQEESPGGLVVRRADDNEAPRRKVIVHHAEPANFDGNLTLCLLNNRLRVFTDPEDGDELDLGDCGVQFANLRIPSDGLELWVQGEHRSDKMRDAGLSLRVQDAPQVRDQIAMTVLWVDKPAVKFEGDVSPTNSSLSSYQQWSRGGTTRLGPRVFDGRFSPVVRLGWGLETRASVHPRDFVFAGSGLKLERDGEWRDFLQNDPEPLAYKSDFSPVIPPGNDTEDALTLPFLQDRDPRPDGFIYDVDAPGVSIDVSAAAGLIQRSRNNFKAFASVLIDGKPVRCSEIREYLVRFSIIQVDAPEGKHWIVLRPPDVEDDLQAKNGRTKLTWNLR